MPERGALLEAIEATLAEEIRVPALELALAGSPGRDAPTRLAEIIGELYDLFARTRRAADAMERCANEAPDVAELFYRGVRVRLLGQLGRAVDLLLQDVGPTRVARGRSCSQRTGQVATGLREWC